MATYVSGIRLIGYGRTIICQRCHNKILEHVSIDYFEMGAFYAPILTTRSKPFVYCPICMVHTESDPSFELLSQILNEGKYLTRQFYQSIRKDPHWKFRRDLKKLGFHDLLAYVTDDVI